MFSGYSPVLTGTAKKWFTLTFHPQHKGYKIYVSSSAFAHLSVASGKDDRSIRLQLQSVLDEALDTRNNSPHHTCLDASQCAHRPSLTEATAPHMKKQK